MLSKIFIPILLIFLIQARQISPLRYAYDDASNDIDLSFNGQRFLLSLQNSIPYTEAVLCFRLREVTNNDAASTCYLANQKEIYDCLTINLIQHVGLHWQADYQLKPSSSEAPFTFNYFLNSTTLIYSLDGKIDGNQTFDYLSQTNSIYQVVALSYDPYVINRVYTHTFSAPDQVRTNNNFFQRHVQCFAERDINYLIFYGGVIRDQIDIYMVAFLTYSRTGQKFSFWGGLSFSSDKSARDMLGVFPLKDNYADLYSLYAAPPYKDISLNVNGTQDWTKISSSFQATQGDLSTYYYMSLYRYYQTVNSKGDQDIILKMNNKYCFVASTNPIVFFLEVQQPYVQNYMHTVLKCFNPNIELYSTLVALSLIFMILFLLLI